MHKFTGDNDDERQVMAIAKKIQFGYKLSNIKYHKDKFSLAEFVCRNFIFIFILHISYTAYELVITSQYTWRVWVAQ